jgi:histidinol-phosphate/aromatic aminotransferase/cobyric acid decarboxylase-like protein
MAPKRTRSGAKVNGKEEAPVGPRKYTRKDLKDLIYHPVRPLDVISEEIGIKAEDIAKLDANENLHPVPAEMMKAVTDALQSLGSGCSAQIYPDPSQTHFRAAIERGLEQGRCVGAASNALQRLRRRPYTRGCNFHLVFVQQLVVMFE